MTLCRNRVCNTFSYDVNLVILKNNNTNKKKQKQKNYNTD